MGESLVGEVICLFSGIAFCLPYIYQLQSQASTSAKSPFPRYCWWLLASGWLGVGCFFSFVPRVNQKQLLDVPESSRSVGYLSFVACILCQVCWAMDGVPPASTKSRKLKSLTENLTGVLCGSFLVVTGIYLLHTFVFLSRPVYRLMLAVVALVTIVCYLGGCITLAMELNSDQFKNGGPEVAGLCWMPIVMQMLGLFSATFTCVLLYTNPDWYGVTLLSLMFAADAIYVGLGLFKASRTRNSYGPIA